MNWLKCDIIKSSIVRIGVVLMIILFPGTSVLKELLKRLDFEIKEEIPLSEDESRLIETVNRKKKLKEMLQSYRKIDIVKMKIAIIKALSFVEKIFNSLWEISAKLLVILEFIQELIEIVERVMIHNKSHKALFCL